MILCVLLPLLISPADGSVPRPEHPRPDAQRAEWLNLNGSWEFAETDDDGDRRYLAAEATFPDRIVVPFCRESALSGLARKGFVKNVWYRRTFERPAAWRAPRVRLHVGACDWATEVFVNGQLAGTHVGGNTEFAFDVTSLLKPGPNTLVIHARDDARSGLQALGKQSDRPESHGIFYTRTTGIWQTVWLEGAGASFIERFTIVPDAELSGATIQADIAGPTDEVTFTAEVSARGARAASASAPAAWRNTSVHLEPDAPHPWSLEDPFLYDVKLTLARDGVVLDQVATYCGLRCVTIEGGAVLLNGKPVFQRLVLDQGFYPDGVWTAPSDEALRADIERAKALGLNGARLHQKVFEPRFLYWADRLGYLVWGEFPSYGANYANPAVNEPITREWVEILQRDRNHPALIGWCPFNETPVEAGALQNCVLELTRAIDPTRPVIDTSGWSHSYPHPEVMDAHDYDQNPVTFRARWQDHFAPSALPPQYGSGHRDVPFLISEFGGIGWYDGKDKASWGYGNQPKTLDELYVRYAGLVDALLDNPRLFGFCYTQLTDVEQEKNGLYTYDRRAKFDAEKIRAITARAAAYESTPPLAIAPSDVRWRVLVGSAADGALARPWRYVVAKPAAEWSRPEFDDASWASGLGGFGKKEGWQRRTRTPWDGKDLWLRQSFAYDGAPFTQALLVLHHDNATEVYLNGQQVWQRDRWNDDYQGFAITEALRPVLKTGTNVIAIHCHQDEGGQFLDAALLLGGATAGG